MLYNQTTARHKLPALHEHAKSSKNTLGLYRHVQEDTDTLELSWHVQRGCDLAGWYLSSQEKFPEAGLKGNQRQTQVSLQRNEPQPLTSLLLLLLYR